MRSKYIIVIAVIALLPICIYFMRWSADRSRKTSERIVAEFKERESAMSSYEPSIEQMIEGLLEAVDNAATKHPELKATADSLIALKDGLQGYILKLKNDNPVDTEGSLPMTFKIEEVSELQRKMSEFYNFSKAHLTTEKDRDQLDKYHANLLFTKEPKAFREAYFVNMPGMAVHTLLSKFSNDANAGTELVLTDIVDRTVSP